MQRCTSSCGFNDCVSAADGVVGFLGHQPNLSLNRPSPMTYTQTHHSITSSMTLPHINFNEAGLRDIRPDAGTSPVIQVDGIALRCLPTFYLPWIWCSQHILEGVWLYLRKIN